MVPFKAVENEGFERLLQVVDLRYELPCQKYFCNTLFFIKIEIGILFKKNRDMIFLPYRPPLSCSIVQLLL